MGRLETKGVFKSVAHLDLSKPCAGDDIIVDQWVRVPSALDGGLKRTTISFHRECPISPNRAAGLNPISNVQKCMHSERTCGKTFGR